MCLEHLCDIAAILYFRANLSIVLLRIVIKLSISGVLFWCFLFNGQRDRRLKYVGHKNKKSWEPHSAILLNRNLFHYIHRELAEKIQAHADQDYFDLTGQHRKTLVPSDPVFCLAATKTRYNNDYLLEILSGFYIGIEEKAILKLLESFGKCHDYAVLTTYQFVYMYNKALAYGILLLLRWETWLIVAIYFLFPFSYGEFGALDVLLSGLIAIDLINLCKLGLSQHREATARHPTQHRLLKCFEFVLLELLVWSCLSYHHAYAVQRDVNGYMLIVLVFWDVIFIVFRDVFKGSTPSLARKGK